METSTTTEEPEGQACVGHIDGENDATLKALIIFNVSAVIFSFLVHTASCAYIVTTLWKGKSGSRTRFVLFQGQVVLCFALSELAMMFGFLISPCQPLNFGDEVR